MAASILPPSEIYAGDSWPGVPLVSIRPNNAVPTVALAAAKVIFFSSEDGPLSPAHTLESPTDILLNSPTAWDLSVKKAILPLQPGEWTLRLSTTDAQNETRTWLTGVVTIL